MKAMRTLKMLLMRKLSLLLETLGEITTVDGCYYLWFDLSCYRTLADLLITLFSVRKTFSGGRRSFLTNTCGIVVNY